MNNERMKIRLILPFWGSAYVRKVMNLTLPALLAPGNIPALIEHADFEIALVTEEAFFDEIRATTSFKFAESLCTVRFIALDDILTGVPGDYGPVLTYAMFRGFADLGTAMVDYYLLFFCADFILADSSLRSLLPLLQKGYRCIHSPSLRVKREDVMPILESRVNAETGVLSMTSREMVSLALEYKHITVKARTVNQQLFHQWRMDQYYWQIDDKTMVGYQWPVAIAALRPERVVTEPVLMFDYGFVPEVCPSGDFYFISDSDNFLILEPQHQGAGEDMIRIGPFDRDAVIKDLNAWTTYEHRVCGVQPFLFHSATLPEMTDEVVSESRSYMQSLVSALAPAVSHNPHPLFNEWWSGVHKRMRETLNATSAASASPELLSVANISDSESAAAPQKKSLFKVFVRWIYRSLFGGIRTPKLPHPLWLFISVLAAHLPRTSQRDNAIAYVCFDNSPISVEKAVRINVTSGHTLTSLGEPGSFDACVVVFTLDDTQNFMSVYPLIMKLLKPNGVLHLFLRRTSDFASQRNKLITIFSALPENGRIDLRTYGNAISWRIQEIYHAINRPFLRWPLANHLILITFLLGTLPFAWWANMGRHPDASAGNNSINRHQNLDRVWSFVRISMYPDTSIQSDDSNPSHAITRDARQ